MREIPHHIWYRRQASAVLLPFALIVTALAQYPASGSASGQSSAGENDSSQNQVNVRRILRPLNAPAPELYFIDKSGKQAISYMFQQAGHFKEGLAPVLIADQWGFIDKSGDVVIGAKFDLAQNFSEGLAAVKLEDKWGYVDRKGNIVIKPRFAVAEEFKNGLAVIQISKDEIAKIEPDQLPKRTFEFPKQEAKGTAQGPRTILDAIALSRRAGMIDRQDRFVIGPLYEMLQNYSDDLALAKEGNTFAFLNKHGELAFKPYWQEARSFSDGHAAVKIKDKWGFIDTNGKLAVKTTLDDVGDFHAGLAAARKNGKWGFINNQGSWVIEPRYDAVFEGFVNGAAVVGKDVCKVKHGQTNLTRFGNAYIISRAEAEDFDESTEVLPEEHFAYPDIRFFLIDKSGRVMGEQYDLIGSLCDGLRCARLDGKYGFIDNLGKLVIKPIYKWTDNFSEGLAVVRNGENKKRLVERNEIILKRAIPSMVTDPGLIEKDLSVCNEIIKLDPSNAQAYRDRGYLRCCLGQYQASLEDFAQLARLCPTSSAGHYWRGLANLQLQRYSDALSDFTNAIEVEPMKSENFWGRAVALMKLKNLDLALSEVNHALSFYDHPAYKKLKGELEEELGDSQAALQDLQAGRKAPDLNPWPVAAKGLVDLQQDIDRLEKQFAAAKKGSDNLRTAYDAAELADAIDELRRLKMGENKLMEVEDLLKESLTLRREALSLTENSTASGAAVLPLKNDLSNGIEQLANWYTLSRDFIKAERLYEEAAKLAAESGSSVKQADCTAALARMYAEQGELARAEEFYKKALKVSHAILARQPNDAMARVVEGQTLSGYGLVLFKTKRSPEGNQKVSEASELLSLGSKLAYLPSPPAAPQQDAASDQWYEAALQCKSLGLVEISRAYGQTAIKSASDQKQKEKAERFISMYLPKCKVNLALAKVWQQARVAEAAGDLRSAENFNQECLAKQPQFIWALQALGRLKRIESDLSAAERYIRKSLQLNPESVEGWVELSRIERARGDKAKASEALLKALSLDPDCQLAQFEKALIDKD